MADSRAEATNKIAGLSDEAGAFLRTFFR